MWQHTKKHGENLTCSSFYVASLLPILKDTMYLINIDANASVIILLAPRCGMKVNLVKMFRFIHCICKLLQVWKIHGFSLALAFQACFLGTESLVKETSRKRDLVVHLPELIFQSSFVLTAFDSIISFLLWYFILNSAENQMPLSQSHPIVMQCFQFAWKIIHVNNSPLFMSYLPKSCQRAAQCKPCCHKVSVHLKAWGDLPSVNSNELKILGT